MLFFVQLSALNSNIFSTRQLRSEVALAETYRHFKDRHQTWLSQLKPNVKMERTFQLYIDINMMFFMQCAAEFHLNYVIDSMVDQSYTHGTELA